MQPQKWVRAGGFKGGVRWGNESLNSLPPSLRTLGGGAVHQHRRVFSKAAPRLHRPLEVASEHSLARVPERPAPESPPPLHLVPSWACQVSQSEIPPEPSTEMQSGGKGGTAALSLLCIHCQQMQLEEKSLEF